MNYKRIYDTIILNAQTRQKFGIFNHLKHKYEKHHIIPRCVGGKDNKENIVKLTCKEHFICHLLLTKIYTEPKQKKSLYAAYLYMAGIATQKGLTEKRNSRQYVAYKKAISEMLSGDGNPMYGKTTSDLQKQRVSEVNKGKVVSEETREKMRQFALGRTHSDATKQKISNKKKLRWQFLSEEQREKERNIARTAMLGKSQTDYQKKCVTEANQKTWQLISPDGQILTITNLNKWAKENGLDQGNLVAVSKGRLKQHKGWKCTQISS